MVGLLAGLCVWISAVGGPAHSASPALSAPDALILSDIPVNTRINGRPIKVQAQMYRNLMPIIGPSAGEMALFVRVSTTDRRGLPNISSVRATVVNSQREVWTPTLRSVLTLVFDPKSVGYSAAQGPRWAPGTPATVRVEIRSGRTTTIVNVPVRINAAA